LTTLAKYLRIPFNDRHLGGLMQNDPSRDPDPSTATQLTLGGYLASVRQTLSMSLRDVEEATNKEVSNAYLSQLENGKIKKPDPNILYSLSEAYGISYPNLMSLAGYIVASNTRTDAQHHGRVATFAEHALTKEEEEELVAYLKFIRDRKKKQHGQT
jgi:transcriptional regulator with XRE-family HTH domain